MGRNKTHNSAGDRIWPIVSLPDIHDLQTIKTIPIMSADDTSILVTGTNK
jgi:hypothetical protein